MLPGLMSAALLRHSKVIGLGLPLEIRKEEENRIPKAKGKMSWNLGYKVPTSSQGDFGTLCGVRPEDGVLCLA